MKYTVLCVMIILGLFGCDFAKANTQQTDYSTSTSVALTGSFTQWGGQSLGTGLTGNTSIIKLRGSIPESSHWDIFLCQGDATGSFNETYAGSGEMSCPSEMATSTVNGLKTNEEIEFVLSTSVYLDPSKYYAIKIFVSEVNGSNIFGNSDDNSYSGGTFGSYGYIPSYSGFFRTYTDPVKDLYFIINDSTTSFDPFIPYGYIASTTYSSINIGGIYQNNTTNGVYAHITSIDNEYSMNYMLPVITALGSQTIINTEINAGDHYVSYPVHDLPNSEYNIEYFGYNFLSGDISGGLMASTTFTMGQTDNINTEYPPSAESSLTSTTTDLVLTCDETDGLFQNSLCKLAIYLFKPSDSVFTDYKNLYDRIKLKPPFGYISKISESLNTITSTATSTINITDVSSLDDDIINPLKQGTELLLWLMFALWMFKRFSHFQP